MSDNTCKWKPEYSPEYECQEPPLDGDEKGWCIIHSETEDKDKDEFTHKVDERMTKGRLTPSGWLRDNIDLVGCYFPSSFSSNYFIEYKFNKPVNFRQAKFSQAHFSKATFLQEADFRQATLSWADFNGAEFSQAALFRQAKFSQAHFSKATFLQEADFRQATVSWAYFWHATFSQTADFSGATFSQEAFFHEAKFSQRAEACFNGAIFSKEANFHNAKFNGGGTFLHTTFNKMANFNGAIFSSANFDAAAFKGDANFTWAEFHGWTFFFMNSKWTFVRFKNPKCLPRDEKEEIEWPEELKQGNEWRIEYNGDLQLLEFKGEISVSEKDKLCNLSNDDSYSRAINDLSEASKVQTLGREKVTFERTRFIGEIRFEDVDLSNCSFLHANIDKVDFRYCDFGQKREKLLSMITHNRQNILKDERDHDDARNKDYEPVRRLYLELKRNFEDNKDWNTAGDFHYGEMECRRKMYGLSTFEGFLVNIYFWLSGYGERPYKATVFLLFFCLLFFPLLLSINDFVPLLWSWMSDCQALCLADCFNTLLLSERDSLKVVSFASLTKIGKPIKPDNSWDHVILVLESIVVYIQILLLALALRRKVKR
ncbi:MAG: pentapeptide repeat-containing protein [Planctomycetes bacterium]|nr:pentapeptide repeat-containing protein [Planctomycetota bacterium]